MEKITTNTLNFEDHFQLPSSKLYGILKKGLSKGGDFSEIFLEYRINHSINMEENIIKDTGESIAQGLGIRVICGEKTGYGFTNDLSFKKIKDTAITAGSLAAGSPPKNIPVPRSSPLNHNFYPVKRPLHNESWKEKIALVKRAYQKARNFHPQIKKVKVTLGHMTQYITVMNSEGLIRSEVRPLTSLRCVAIAEKNEKRQAGFSGGGGRVGREYFQNQLTPEDIAGEAAQEALLLLEGLNPPAGEMPVILGPGHSGVLIHEAVGHLLEADFNRKKTSIFWNKMDQKVGNEQVTIYDDPTLPHFRGSYNMDDEGTLPQKTLLIHQGKLTGWLQDKLSARLMNQPLTGHGRRQDYTCIPIPRMSNTYLGPGNYSPEDIIKSVSKGFYAQKFQGGQVEDSGKFTFSVNSGYLIENGRLTAPIKQATLIGSNIDILKKVEMVGNDLKFSYQTGTCGKEGQEIPVTDGCPTLKIARMTVGGRK
ncbi:TldD/PmbA family protein [bacterium]|nr:TldD/PmbA family protein [bacterium]